MHLSLTIIGQFVTFMLFFVLLAIPAVLLGRRLARRQGRDVGAITGIVCVLSICPPIAWI